MSCLLRFGGCCLLCVIVYWCGLFVVLCLVFVDCCLVIIFGVFFCVLHDVWCVLFVVCCLLCCCPLFLARCCSLRVVCCVLVRCSLCPLCVLRCRMLRLVGCLMLCVAVRCCLLFEVGLLFVVRLCALLTSLVCLSDACRYSNALLCVCSFGRRRVLRVVCIVCCSLLSIVFVCCGVFVGL